MLNLTPATSSAKVCEISKLLIEVGAEVCQRLPQPIGVVNFSRKVKNTDGTVCLAYFSCFLQLILTEAVNQSTKSEKKYRGFGVSFLDFSACMNQTFRLNMSLKAALFPLLPHDLDMKAVEEMESKWDSGERGPIYPQ